MPCALLLLLLSLGNDFAAKIEKNRMRDENKKAFTETPGNRLIHSRKKKNFARHASYSARIELKPRPQVGATVVCCYTHLGFVPNEAEQRQQPQPINAWYQ